jgi:hypothetical protein
MLFNAFMRPTHHWKVFILIEQHSTSWKLSAPAFLLMPVLILVFDGDGDDDHRDIPCISHAFHKKCGWLVMVL